jgi:hypothetical protein
VPVKEMVLLAGLVLGLATAITTHVALAGRILLRQRPLWRGVVAFFIPPLALLWAIKAGWRKTAVLWAGSIAVYAIALIVASLVRSPS